MIWMVFGVGVLELVVGGALLGSGSNLSVRVLGQAILVIRLDVWEISLFVYFRHDYSELRLCDQI